MNPELRRNLWLELTVHRMVAMPAVLGLVFALIYAASDTDPRASLAVAAAVIAAGLAGLWGARNAADSVPEEVRGRTWDAQRMSAIGPWAMTWGKLLGATAFAWYGGLMALAVLVLAAPPGWTHSSAKIAALIVAASVLAQGVGAIAGLMVGRKGPARQGAASSLVLLLVILLLAPGLGVFASSEQPVTWWGRDYGLVDFSLASAAVFALWALAGVYRMMCAELQVRTMPWVLAAFVLFVAGYIAGFIVPPGAGLSRARDALLVTGLLVSGAVSYLMLFSEQTRVIVFRRVQVRLARGELWRAVEELPGWPVSLALAGVFCALGVAFLGTDGRSEGRELLAQVSLAPLPLFLLLARDAAIYLIFAFGRRPGRVEAAAAFYLVLLYLVLPWLLHAAGLTALAELVLPPVFARPGYSATVAAAQAAIAAGFAAWRWRARTLQEAAT
jgi:hypothetical protein